MRSCSANLLLSGNTALLRAVMENDAEKVELLLSAGSDVLVCNNGGDTALHLAAIVANPKLIQVFNARIKSSKVS